VSTGLSRRAFLNHVAQIAGCYAAESLLHAVYAEQPVLPRRIGVLLVSWSSQSKVARAFKEGLQDVGEVEGRDVVLEWREAHGDYSRVPELAAELVRSRVDVIVANGTVATREVKRLTSTIPIVTVLLADPVGSGLVTSLAHPGGNVTGNSIMSPDLTAKRLQLLVEVVPRATRVAVLGNPETPYKQKVVEQLKDAARALSVELKFIDVHAPGDFDLVFSAVRQMHVQALYVIEDALFETNRPRFLKLASTVQLPIVYWARHWPDEGGLMSYGPSYSGLLRQAAGYVDKILKGARPGDLPIEQPSNFELVVNLKMAKALNIAIPESVLIRADEVIR
jgi:putative tryptophan/tyrosine transport system substrate-binding protein